MIEYIEELRIESQFYSLGHWKPLRKIKIAPEELRTTQRIAAEVSKLAIVGGVASVAAACARIDGRDKCIRVEPLHRSGKSDAWNWIVIIERDTGNNTRKLRAASVHNAVAVR